MIEEVRYEPQMPLSALQPSPWNPRKTFREAEMKDLADSLATYGVLNALVARPMPGTKGIYEIACGERRYRAAKMAGLEHVPVRVQDMEDERFLDLMMLDNIQRVDVHPMEEAESFAAWCKRPGHTARELAERVSKSVRYVEKRMKLVELIQPLRDACREGRLPVSHALELARLSAHSQKLVNDLSLWDSEGGAQSLEHVRGFIKRKIFLDLSKAVFSTKDKGLVPTAGACVTCEKRTGANLPLYEDAVLGDHCHDPQCFDGKVEAHTRAVLVKLETKQGKGQVLQVADVWFTDNKKVKTKQHFRVADKGSCNYAKEAVCVKESAAEGGLRQGEVLYVCMEKDCEVHWQTLDDNRPAWVPPPKTLEELRKDLERTRGFVVTDTARFLREASEKLAVEKVCAWDEMGNLAATLGELAVADLYRNPQNSKVLASALGIAIEADEDDETRDVEGQLARVIRGQDLVGVLRVLLVQAVANHSWYDYDGANQTTIVDYVLDESAETGELAGAKLAARQKAEERWANEITKIEAEIADKEAAEAAAAAPAEEPTKPAKAGKKKGKK